MRILFLNWRDLANPSAGGAETFTEEIGRRLINYGNDVTIFTSSFIGCEQETSTSGLRIIRQGGKYTVYRRARTYVRNHLSEYDVIIDEINTIPFRIRRVAKSKPMVAVIHQLAKEIWFYETRFPLNLLGSLVIEPLLLREYRRVPTITVSQSTKDDLLRLGFNPVHIVQNGISAIPLGKPPEKESNPVLIFVGRLVRCKLPDHAIQAFKHIKALIHNAELWVVGDGYLRRKLETGAPEGVKFLGRVANQEKYELLKRAHVLLAPSVREGWGISVIEANAMGTPAVGYAVPGLKDSIVDGVTGRLVPRHNTRLLASAAYEVLCDTKAWQGLARNALDWSKKFSWDNSAERFQRILESTI